MNDITNYEKSTKEFFERVLLGTPFPRVTGDYGFVRVSQKASVSEVL